MACNASVMPTANIDKVLASFATVETAATGGTETALQKNVMLGLGTKTYTDATPRQYLIDVFGWTTDCTLLVGTVGGTRSVDAFNQSAAVTGKSIHRLGANDAITGSAFGCHNYGRMGNDTLNGRNGQTCFTSVLPTRAATPSPTLPLA